MQKKSGQGSRWLHVKRQPPGAKSIAKKSMPGLRHSRQAYRGTSEQNFPAASREKSVCRMHIGSLLRMRAHPGKTAEAPGKRPERHGKGASPPKRAGQTSCHPAARLSKKRQANRKRASERIPVQCGCHACPSALVSAAVQLGSAESRSAAPAGLAEVPAASRQKPPPPMHFQRVRIPAELYRSEKPKRRKRPT